VSHNQHFFVVARVRQFKSLVLLFGACIKIPLFPRAWYWTGAGL